MNETGVIGSSGRVRNGPLHKLLGYLSKVAPKIFKSCPNVAHFMKKLLKSCFLSTKKNQFLQLMKVNLCTTIRIIYLFIYSFLLADISVPTEMIFYSSRHFENVFRLQTADHVAHWKHTPTGNPKFRRSHKHNTLHRWQYSRTSIIRTSMIRTFRLSGPFLWSRFLHEY